MKGHILISKLRAREHIETKRPGKVFLVLFAPLKGADANLEGSKTLHFVLDFLVPFLYSVVFVVVVVETYIAAYKNTKRNKKRMLEQSSKTNPTSLSTAKWITGLPENSVSMAMKSARSMLL